MVPKFAKPNSCQGCSLEKDGLGFAPPIGPTNSPLLFVGESLGPNEAMRGEPFVGDAGGMLGWMFRRSAISRDTVRIHNSVNCRPPGDWLEGSPWEHSALTHCSQYLNATLNEPHKVVVPLGGVALRRVLGLTGDGISVKDFHGTINRDPQNRFWVVPTFHPSHLQRGAINLLDVVRFDLDRALSVSRNGWAPRPVSLLQDPTLALFAAWVDRYLLAARQDPGGIWLSVDCETPDKSGGRDEGELTPDDQSTTILRLNFSCHPDEGLTVPYVADYISLCDKLLTAPYIKVLWNKNYDLGRLALAGHQIDRMTCWDLMWAWHRLQSDLPRGLGFAAPFFSDYGAWKHLGKLPGKEAEYAAVDGFQTLRCGHGIVKLLVEQNMWDTFYDHTHRLEELVLYPAHREGMNVDVPALDAFHQHLDVVCGEKLAEIQQREAAGTLKPKNGYAKKPKGAKCPECDGGGRFNDCECLACAGTGNLGVKPPQSVLGKKKEAAEKTAKDGYIEAGIRLVERDIEIDASNCLDCGKTAVPPSHNCLRPKKSRVRVQAVRPTEEPPSGVDGGTLLQSRIEKGRSTVRRWFWQLPFNPDSSQQLLRYITDTGHSPGKAKKTRKPTSNAETLRRLAKSTGDPIYQSILDYRAVKKVDSTYALGVKKRIWADGRIHPIYTFKPSMARLSYVSPNITNVVADKGGKDTLAAGFRRCLVASPGCRLLEVDYSGIEAVETGRFCRNPDYIRLARLGVHAYLTSHLIGKPAELSWSDDDLVMYFSDIKKKYPVEYDKAKRCLTGDHEVLTPEGWVRLDEYTVGVAVAQWTEDGQLSFVVPTSTTRIPFSGTMIGLHGRSLSAVMTPDHRVPTRYRTSAKWKVHTADQLPTQGEIPSAGVLTGGEDVPDVLLRLVVAVQADAAVGSGGAVFHLHKSRKIERLKMLLDHAGMAYSTVRCGCDDNPGVRIRINSADADRLCGFLEGKDKLFHLPLFLRLSLHARETVLDELTYWDGHIKVGHRYEYFTSHYNQAVRVQTIAATIGRQALLRTQPPSPDKYGTGSQYVISFNHRANAALESLERRKVPYSGIVYCLTVPSSFFLIRHNDRISVTGNCVHGNNYGLSIYGMVENFPDVYHNLKEAQEVQDLYYSVAPSLPTFHREVQLRAKQWGFLGGRHNPPREGDHPYGYKHWFFGVESIRRVNQEEYLRLKAKHSPNLTIIDGRPYKRALGEDSKRVIAFFPQSTAAGVLIDAMLLLFDPDSQFYIGDTYFGRTPLRAPIHDSLLLDVPTARWDYVLERVAQVMQREIVEQPIPEAWGMGKYLRIGIAAKAGQNWMDMEEVPIKHLGISSLVGDVPHAGVSAVLHEKMYLPEDIEDREEQVELETVIRGMEEGTPTGGEVHA